MGSFEMVSLGDVCEIINGYAFKSANYSNHGVRIIRITNVQKGLVCDDDPKYHPPSSETDKFKLLEDDLLISLTGNVGRVGLIKADLLPAALNQRVACLRLSKLIEKKFLYHFLNTDMFESNCINESKGLAQKNMSTQWLKTYKVPCPKIETQLEIVKIIDKTAALLTARRYQIEKLDLLIKSQFIQMFGDQNRNEFAWDEGTIRDVVTDVKYGTSLPAVDSGKYKYLRMNNITYDGHLDISNLKYIDIPAKDLDKYIVGKGDVLFNRTNSKELVGKTCVYNLDEPMVIAGYIIRVRTNERANPVYLSAVLNSTYGKTTLFDMCKAIVGQANINAQELQNIKILIPPISLQNQFADFVQQVEQQKSFLQKSLTKMEENYKSLMQKCFRGEIFS